MTTSEPKTQGAAPPKWAIKAMTRTHVILNRLTGGRWFNSLRADAVCFVSVRVAKGVRLVRRLRVYVLYGEGVLLVASLGGAPKNPVWYVNLVAHPDRSVTHRGRRMELRARLARPDEKPKLWPIADKHYAPYADYRGRTTRDIPIFVCEPR